jgi:hypothetical protein
MRILVLCLALASGCARLMGYSDAGSGSSAPIRQYEGGADGLKAFFTDVLDAVKKDDRGRVHDLLATTIMSDADLEALFGAQGAQVSGRYKKLMETLVNRGAVELVAQVYERKLDTVEVVQVDPAAKDANAADRAVAASLKTPITFYSVRIRKAADQKGLRYDFFFYRDGKWRTGNQIGKYLEGYKAPDGGT